MTSLASAASSCSRLGAASFAAMRGVKDG